MLQQKSFIAILSVGLALMASSASAEILVYEPFAGVPGEAFAGVETESVNLGPWSEPVPRIATDNAQFVEFPAYTDPDGVVLPSKGVGAVLRGDLFDESVALDSPATFADGRSAWIGLQAGLRDKGGNGFDRQHSRIRFHFDASDLEVRWDTEGPGGARDNQMVQLVLQGASGGATRSGEDIPYPAVGEPVNEFILIRIDFSPGDETIHLWRNPSLSSRPEDADALLTGTQELGNTLSGITARTQAFHTELILDEIRIGETFNDAVGQGGSNAMARSPLPKNESNDVPYEGTTLSWRAGEFAQTHNVYFGTAFDDVNNASVSAPLGVLVSGGQSDNAYDPGRLDFDQTYYWRVDEVNGAPDFTVFKGDVWSITAEPFSLPISDVTVTASSTFGNALPDHTVDGSGLTGDLHSAAVADMWISGSIPASIEYAFGRPYKLDEMWVWNSNQIIESFVGFGAKDVVIEYSLDGTEWTQLEGVTSLAQAPGADGYAANNVVDFGGAAARHVRITINSVHGIAPQTGLSEVRFFSIPVRAREAQPENGATGLDPAVVLGWRPGRGAVSHDIALSSDPADATVIETATDNTFDTAALDLQLGVTYFWSITEVNDAETPSAWASDTWRFSIVDSLVVDDMESYQDAEFLEIWATWIDGFDDPANGSLVGTGASGNEPETSIVYEGSQSMPMTIDNTAAPKSEATRTFDAAQDWTRSGIQSLVLYFKRGAE
ncbi:MAG: discoidin domain-containing protein, partial [Planctomycetes bacterium]|nr:discoidin domain-containing protein [Planctomycetota bacterium]